MVAKKKEQGESEKQELAGVELELEEVQRKLNFLHKQTCDLRGRREQLLETRRQLRVSLTKKEWLFLLNGVLVGSVPESEGYRRLHVADFCMCACCC